MLIRDMHTQSVLLNAFTEVRAQALRPSLSLDSGLTCSWPAMVSRNEWM